MAPAVALGLAAAGLKLAVGMLALALIRPWDVPHPGLGYWPGGGASAVLACYDAIQVTAGSLNTVGRRPPRRGGQLDRNALTRAGVGHVVPDLSYGVTDPFLQQLPESASA